MASQAGQTEFVVSHLKGARHLKYLEIGAQHPVILNNTYELEVDYFWTGVSLDILSDWEIEWQQKRKNKLIISDATTFDYAALETKHYNYLSCDINPPTNTFLALKQVIQCGLTFDIITFEHDYYTGIDMHIRDESRLYLTTLGYKLERADITADFQKATAWMRNNGLNTDHALKLGCAPFEDWYISTKNL